MVKKLYLCVMKRKKRNNRQKQRRDNDEILCSRYMICRNIMFRYLKERGMFYQFMKNARVYYSQHHRGVDMDMDTFWFFHIKAFKVTTCMDIAYILFINAFNWINTEEGHEYWRDICDDYCAVVSRLIKCDGSMSKSGILNNSQRRMSWIHRGWLKIKKFYEDILCSRW